MRVFRKVCRWLHRELGYLTVGLTLVYAASGLAVNHAHHWNASYRHTEATSHISPVGTGGTPEVAAGAGDPGAHHWRVRLVGERPSLLDRTLDAGTHAVTWDPRARGIAAPNGVYFARLDLRDERSSVKLVRMR